MTDDAATPVHASSDDRWVDTDATGDHDDLSGPHATDHGDDMDGHDDHAHQGEGMDLGPVDRLAWGVGVLGVALGVIVAVLAAISIGYL